MQSDWIELTQLAMIELDQSLLQINQNMLATHNKVLRVTHVCKRRRQKLPELDMNVHHVRHIVSSRQCKTLYVGPSASNIL